MWCLEVFGHSEKVYEGLLNDVGYLTWQESVVIGLHSCLNRQLLYMGKQLPIWDEGGLNDDQPLMVDKGMSKEKLMDEEQSWLNRG